MSPDLSSPGDERRFVHYARNRGIPFEIAIPGTRYDLVVVTDGGDLNFWADSPHPVRVVYDIMDAYLAVPLSNPRGLLRGLAKYVVGQSKSLTLDYRKSIANLCRRADAVVINTEEQRSRVAPLCANTHRIMDAHSSYTMTKTKYSAGEVFNIAWEGFPENLAPFSQLTGVFSDLEAKRPIALHFVTKPRFKRFMGRFFDCSTQSIVSGVHPRTYLYDWTPETVAHVVSKCDLAIIPLDLSDPLSSGKSSNKLLIFWRMAMPTITSSSSAYMAEMSKAGLDMHCRDAAAWKETLEKFIQSEDLRRRAGEAGRRYVESEYGEAANLLRWDALFTSLD